jgi:hypothetical protein
MCHALDACEKVPTLSWASRDSAAAQHCNSSGALFSKHLPSSRVIISVSERIYEFHIDCAHVSKSVLPSEDVDGEMMPARV